MGVIFSGIIYEMPFELAGGAGDLLAFGGNSDASLLNSSLYTAIIMTVVIILIILIMYPCSRKATVWQRIKTFMYIFAASFFILVVHKGTITRVLQGKNQSASSERLLQNMNDGNTVADSIAVEPKPLAVGGSISEEAVLREFGV